MLVENGCRIIPFTQTVQGIGGQMLTQQIDPQHQMLLGEPVMTLADGAFFADYGVPDMGIVFGPFLFDNWDQCWKLTESDWWAEQCDKLNALGLKMEAAGKKHAVDSNDFLPRVAQIGERVIFRQPSIKHEIWIRQVCELVKEGDLQSLLAVQAFALSRPPAELPDALNMNNIVAAVQTYANALGDYTRDQIAAALEYVIFGASPLQGEYPPKPKKTAEECDGFDGEDWKHCVAVGVLREGQAALWGVSAAELEQMTRRQVADLTRRAVYEFHDFDIQGEVRAAQGRYFDTLFEIKARLENEKAEEMKNG